MPEARNEPENARLVSLMTNQLTHASRTVTEKGPEDGTIRGKAEAMLRGLFDLLQPPVGSENRQHRQRVGEQREP
jgi:hypothetical protein